MISAKKGSHFNQASADTLRSAPISIVAHLFNKRVAPNIEPAK